MNTTKGEVERRLEEIRVEKHRLAQQKYYWSKKGQSITNQEEIERLREQVNYLTGQLEEKERTRVEIEARLEDRGNVITRLEQQLTERNAEIVQLQGQISRCDNEEVNRRLEELRRALEERIQSEQVCLQTISQLMSENEGLKAYRDMVAELNTRYPRLLPSYIYEMEMTGNRSGNPQIQQWSRSLIQTLIPNELRSLQELK